MAQQSRREAVVFDLLTDCQMFFAWPTSRQMSMFGFKSKLAK